jgi:hypothetical protein
MSFEEKRAWIMVVVAAGGYAAYLFVIVGRAGSAPLTDVPYVSALLWTMGAGMAAAIVLNILVAAVSPEGVGKTDERDRQIGRFGEYAGSSFIVLGGLAALGMAMAEMNHFWIANVLYLGFVLSAILGSAAKIVAYRRGFQSS